ncbi:MAG: sensor histidine kinase [Candidatus Nanopelagicales bacterium]
MGLRTRLRRTSPAPESPPAAPVRRESLALLASLPGEWVLFDPHDRASMNSDGMHDLGLLQGDRLASAEAGELVQRTRSDGRSHVLELAIGGVAFGAPPRLVSLRSAPLEDGRVLLFVDDISAASRVDAMRREFIVNVSDELQAPVAALLQLADAMSVPGGDPESLAGHASRMEAEANRLSALVGDLTDLSRLQASDSMDHARFVSVRDLIFEAVDSVSAAARERAIVVEREVPDLRLFANGEQLVTAIRNLLTNAIAYSARGTTVTVSAQLQDGYVGISVEDQGMGIPPDQIERIFDRFHRVDDTRSRNAGGTGLGLAIVQHICVAHGGEVTVESTVGRGSMFTMRFPARGRTRESSAPEWKEVP